MMADARCGIFCNVVLIFYLLRYITRKWIVIGRDLWTVSDFGSSVPSFGFAFIGLGAHDVLRLGYRPDCGSNQIIASPGSGLGYY